MKAQFNRVMLRRFQPHHLCHILVDQDDVNVIPANEALEGVLGGNSNVMSSHICFIVNAHLNVRNCSVLVHHHKVWPPRQDKCIGKL